MNYTNLYKLKLTKKDVKNILSLMQEERSFDFEKELPEDIYIVSCDCSDASIDDSPCDGFIMKEYKDIIFADPESPHGSFYEIIAHELVHTLQNYRYFKFADEYEDPYSERWFEKMAFHLQTKVKEYIEKKKLLQITDDEIDIENFLGEKITMDMPL